jgi:glycosyltransferase involved in cell wall biosynthesis
MGSNAKRTLLVDGREFVSGRRTGIGRFLEGLLRAVRSLNPEWQLEVLLDRGCELPLSLKGVKTITAEGAGEFAFSRQCVKLSRSADLYISPYPKLPLLSLYCPMIHTVHDVFYLTHGTYRRKRLRTMVAKWRLNRSLSRATLTWFVSAESKRACEDLVGPVEHAAIRYSPVESGFSPVSPESSSLEYFLCVGNGMPHKNVEILLRAIRGTDLKLKCVGISEEAKRRMMAQFSDVGEQVQFLRGVDDTKLIELYRNAIALLLPSLEEGYGFPPLEAMACGTPAIVSDIPVLRESTGGEAVYCHPHDADMWLRAMLEIQDEEVREGYRLRMLNWVQGRQGEKGWQKHLDDMRSLMESG